MYDQVKKSTKNKCKVVANSVAQKKCTANQCFNFFNSSPQVVAQMKFNYSRNEGNKYLSNSSQPVIQMAKVTKKSTLKILNDVKNSKKPLKHKRSATAYGYLNKSGKKLQGPHTTAHVTTAVALEVAKRRKRKTNSVLGSKLVPRPRQVVHLVNKALEDTGAQPISKLMRKRMTLYFRMYRNLYRTAEKGSDRALEKLIELSPYQTYGWKKGSVTAANMDGKGERKPKSIIDLLKFYGMKKGDPIPKGVTTIDTGSLSKKETKVVADRARQLGEFALGDGDLSEASYDSESDSEVSMDT